MSYHGVPPHAPSTLSSTQALAPLFVLPSSLPLTNFHPSTLRLSRFTPCSYVTSKYKHAHIAFPYPQPTIISASAQSPKDGNPVPESNNETNSDTKNSEKKPNPTALVLQAPKEALARLLKIIRLAFAPFGFFWGMAAGCVFAAIIIFMPESSLDQSLREKVAIFDLILQDISSSYVDAVDLDKLFETGVNSMLGTLDPYTQFENNAEASELNVRTSGKYAGVGLGISATEAEPSVFETQSSPNTPTTEPPNVKANNRRTQITVVSAFEGYAFDAGVRPGDIIQFVDDKETKDLTLEQVTDLLRGEPGTKVAVKVKREGRPNLLTFNLDRRQVQIRDVPVVTLIGQPENGIGYIALKSFAKDAAEEVRTAITQLITNANNASPERGLRALVLDLRGNPGGLLNAAVEVAETFVPRDSVIVSTSGRGISDDAMYRSNADPVLPRGTRLAVLVNGQTASASEIVAGAVQDLDLGVVVGSRTFGKGLIQNVQNLPSRTALKYTVGKYLTPSGRCIQAYDYRQGGSVVIAAQEKLDDDKPKTQKPRARFEAREIPDTERREFRTASGRPVRDGGGIEPDISVKTQSSFLEAALVRQNMFFKYANRYAAERALDELPEPFVVTDGIFRDFMTFVSSSKFKYESQFDEAFNELDSMFDSIGYDSARGRVADLRKTTEQEMREDFVRHESALRTMLESAIRFRLQPDSVRIKAELRNDVQLAEALRVLQNGREYNSLLQPPHKPQQAIVDNAKSEGTELNG